MTRSGGVRPLGSGGAGLAEAELVSVQRRTVWLLSLGQVLGGFAAGATVSLGALLASEVSGSTAWSGMAATMLTLGAAAVAIPLARLAAAKGRRPALAVGALVAAGGSLLTVTSVALGSFPLLLVSLLLLGSGSAVGLQARFAATDLASDRTRARDLSFVVWSTTLGAVAGPNLLEPGEAIGGILGLPPLTGAFVFGIVAQLLAVAVYLVGLRPDPLLTVRAVGDAPRPGARALIAAHPSTTRRRFAMVAVALSHATMVSVMAMTPVHLQDHGATLSIIGLTISLHVAGMYALSPVFGIIADRAGRLTVIVGGQILLGGALLVGAIGSDSNAMVALALILLGLGWSASTVAGSALLTESTEPPLRARVQGFSDMAMNLAGAVGGALAGPVLALVGFNGLSCVVASLVAVVIVWALLARTRS
ncbi:MFS transporter [Okibacterium endophyticum]